MSSISTKNQVWYMVEETTVDTEEAISSGAEAVAVLDGGSITISKENIERNIITSGLGKAKSLGGKSLFSGSVSVEAKANGTAGGAPEYEPMLKSVFGVRSGTAGTAGVSNTTSLLNFADTSAYAVGDIVLVKESGAYWISPIASIVTDTSITLKYAASDAFSDGVTVEAFRNYQPLDSGHSTLSIFREMSGDSATLTDKMSGVRCNSMALGGFSTGGLPQFDFGFQGLAGSRVLSGSGQTPSYDSAQPPVVLSAMVRVNGSEVCLNDFSFSIENALGEKTCVSEESGVSSLRVTERMVSGSINPYKADDSLVLYNLAQNRTTFELFVAASVPTGVAGEVNNVVSFYFPTCVISENAQGDVNGIVTEDFSFQAFSSAGSAEVIIGMI